MFTSIELIINSYLKNGYKLELQRTETIKLFGNTKKGKTKKTKNGEKVQSLEVVEKVFV